MNPGDKAFKSLQSTKNKENEAENAEFNTLRQDAIAEASKAGTKKTFGGGSKQMLDSNVQKIMDKGYSQEQAETALRHSKNNLDRALANIKRRDERERQYQEGSGGAQGHREYSGGKRGAAAASTDGESKPSTKVSLFEFFEDKLNTDQEFSNISSHTAQNKRSGSYGNERFENNISSSFRSKGDKDGKFPQTNSASYSKSSHRSSTATTTSRVDSREPRDSRNSRDYRDSRDSRDSRDTRDSNSHPRDLRDKYSASSSYYQDRPKNGFAGKPTAQPYKHQGGREESGSYHKEYKDYNKTSYKGDYKPEYRGEARGEARGDNRDRDFKVRFFKLIVFRTI